MSFHEISIPPTHRECADYDVRNDVVRILNRAIWTGLPIDFAGNMALVHCRLRRFLGRAAAIASTSTIRRVCLQDGRKSTRMESKRSCHRQQRFERGRRQAGTEYDHLICHATRPKNYSVAAIYNTGSQASDARDCPRTVSDALPSCIFPDQSICAPISTMFSDHDKVCSKKILTSIERVSGRPARRGTPEYP